MVYIAVLIWNLAVLALLAWAVFVGGHSGWWFLLMIPLLCSISRTKQKGERDE